MINFCNRNKTHLLNSLSVLVLLLVAVLYYSACSQGQLENLFNSDSLQIASMYKDLFVDNNSINGWGLSTSASFFPDMFFYFLLNFIFGSFIKATIYYGFLQIIILTFLLNRIYRLVNPSLPESLTTISILLLSLFFLCNILFGYNLYAFLLISNNYHVGTFNCALLSYWLLLLYFKNNKSIYLILLFVVLFLAQISDRLFLVLFYLPVVSIIVIVWITKPKTIKIVRIGLLFLLFISAIAISEYGHYKIATSGIVEFPKSTLTNFGFLTEKVGNTVTLEFIWSLIKDYIDIISAFSVRSILISMIGVSFILSVVVAIKNVKRIRKTNEEITAFYYYNCFSVLFFIIVILAPLSHWHHTTENDWTRFYFSAYILALFNLPIWIAFLFKNKLQKIIFFNKFILFVLVMSFVLTVITLIKNESFTKFRALLNYYPENVKEIDKMAEQNKLHYGVADYWDAKVINMFTRKNLHVYAVHFSMCPYEVLANNNWFYQSIENKNEAPVFNFIVMNRFERRDYIEDSFCDSIVKIKSRTTEIWKVPDFYYIRTEWKPQLIDKQKNK